MIPKTIRKLIPLALLTLAAVAAGAQSVRPERQVVANAGGSASAAGKRLDFTIGEPVTATLAAPSSVVFTQGFQQPDLPLISTAVVPHPGSGGDIQVDIFPNPVAGSLNLRFGVAAEASLRMKAYVFSQSGQLMMPALPLDNLGSASIDCRSLASGKYLLYLHIPGREESGAWLSFIKADP